MKTIPVYTAEEGGEKRARALRRMLIWMAWEARKLSRGLDQGAHMSGFYTAQYHQCLRSLYWFNVYFRNYAQKTRKTSGS